MDSYGHGCIWIVDNADWVGKPDASHLDRLRQAGADFYLTLDHNREPDVWAAVYGRLADGAGRMLRIKLKPRERQGIPTLARYWANAYERFEPWLVDPEKSLIQVGMRITSNRREPDWVRAYTREDISEMVQQQFHIHAGNLVRTGTPQRNVPRGPGRPPRQ